jgi:antirestriction protein ArdC
LSCEAFVPQFKRTDTAVNKPTGDNARKGAVRKATYGQRAEIGAQVRSGEKSSPVIFYKEFEAQPDPDDAGDDGKRRVARASRVFTAAQVSILRSG